MVTLATTTLIAITNVSSEAQIVHVTLWTDYSVAILDFNILLTGYDVQTMNIRDILRDGQLPVTYQYRRSGTTDRHGRTVTGMVTPRRRMAQCRIPRARRLCRLVSTCPFRRRPVSSRTTASASTVTPSSTRHPIPASVLALFEKWLKKSQTVDRVYRTCANEIVDAVPRAVVVGPS